MILLVENITNKVLSVYSEYACTPSINNAYSVKFFGDIPVGNGDLFYNENTLFYIRNQEIEDDLSKIESKTIRQELVDNIEVIYNGIVYQGDEVSQSRISRAINGLPDDITTIQWKAKDNTSHELNRLDLKQILYLAGQEQTRIWFLQL